MKDFSDRLSSLTPEQRALFESRLKKKDASRARQGVVRGGSIPKRKRENHCLLSFDQERIWIIDRMEPGNPAYNIYTVSRLLGPLNLEAMERAVNEIIRRHEILRTTFSTEAGEPVMVISPEMTVKFSVRDISRVADEERLNEAVQLANEATALPFDLEKGPLLRAGIIRLGDDDHVVHVTMHHSITDRWSAAVLEQEMVSIYSAFIENKPSPLAPVDLQFADFAEWQRDYLQGEVLAAKLDYWAKQLAGAPLVLDLPTDRPRPPFQKFRGAREVITLPEPLLKDLKAFTQAEGATMFMTLLAAYNLLLYRYTCQEDILIGLAMANRNRPETENMLGYLLNMVIIRAKFSARTSFRELLAIVRQSSVGAFANLDLPMGSLIDELKPTPDPSRNPIFQMAYIYLDFPPEMGMEFLKINPVPLEADNGSSRFDMTLALTELPDRLETLIEYNTDLFDPETIRRMLQHLRVLLEGIARDPDLPLSELPMLTASELQQVSEIWNEPPVAFPSDQCVHQLVEIVAARSPDSIAVTHGESELTYAEVNTRANKLAHYLMSLGVGVGGRAAVCLQRSPDLIVTLLGVLKTGAAYVPIDPGYPLVRVARTLEDAQCYIVISQESLIDSLPSQWGITVSIDADWQGIEVESTENPRLEPLPDSPAYVLYTSGSTGGPKGVSVPHRAISRLVLNTNYIDLEPDSIVAQCSNASFDAVTFEIWGALSTGSRLVIIDKDVALSPHEFSDEIRRHAVTAMFLTTSLFNQVARHSPRAFRSMKYLLFGGEAVTPSWVKSVVEAGPPENLLHVYGPTENTTFSSFFSVNSVAADDAIPIGLPISNTVIHVVDHRMNPVPAGVIGELLLGGEGLAHCYLNRPELTADRFIPNALAASPGERLYRSGDLARRRPDGNIVFLGRNDFQVKVRGFRIELEEIESVIKRHPALVDAAVAVTDGSEHERRLAAYVVPRTDSEITISELRRFVGESLPEYMAPSAMVEMSRLPLTANGKVDRSKLPDPEEIRPDLAYEYIAPRTTVEGSLCEAWASILKLDRVGIRDNFFDLGGDSIRSIQIMSHCEKSGFAFSIQELFRNPTVESLAAVIDSRTAERRAYTLAAPFSTIRKEDRALIPESVEEAYALTLLQAGMIFHSELSPSTAVYHDIFSFHLRAPLDLELMQQSLDQLIARHEILRTSFNLTGLTEPLQFVWKHAELPVQFDDISALAIDAQQDFIRDFVRREKSKGFSWDRAPLLRVWIHKRTEESFQLTLSFHHAILDGWSLATFFAELFQVYLIKVDGRAEPAYLKPGSSFKMFVALETEAVQSQECRGFWTDLLDNAPFTTVSESETFQAASPSGEIDIQPLDLAEELSRKLLELSRRLGVPLKSVLLAVHAKVLALLSGRNDIVTGLISNGRPEEKDADRLLGLFLNTLPLRMRLAPSDTWEELIQAAFNIEREMLPYRRYPLAEMQRVTGRNPLLVVAFNYTHFHAVSGVLAGQDIEILDEEIISETNFHFLLDFNLDPASSELQGAIKYDRALFDRNQIELIGGYYSRAFNLMAESPTAGHASVPLLSYAEIDSVIYAWNSTDVDYSAFVFVHELVEEQAGRMPDAIGLVSDELHLSYGEVNREANRLAFDLARFGAGPERRIGILLDRSASMCIALLAILKTGSAYVPIDAAFPDQRVELMLREVDILLTQSSSLGRLAGMKDQGTAVLCIDELEQVISSETSAAFPTTMDAAKMDAENLVYVIFTSGSTGVPKGVAVTHRVATNMIRWNIAAISFGRRVLQFTSVSFDVAFQEIFSTWAAGGALVLIADSDRRDPAMLARHIIEHRVERLFLPSIALQQLAEQLLIEESSLPVREVITAGEQLKISSEVRSLFQGSDDRRFHNHYGPSETHVATAYQLPQGSPWPDLPPIGTPIANAQIYVLSENLEAAPRGVPGEIFIGGEIVGRGYIARPELTAQSFLCNPYGRSGSRLYRTGDMGRWRPDGQIEFLGRLDSQVKVRGFRVEIGEVEAALSAHPGVRQAAVTAFDGAESKKLVAYMVPAAPDSITVDEMSGFLRARLPSYMLPSDYVFLESLPVTATGKVDKQALPPPDTARTSKAEYVPPGTPAEQAVAAIWSEVLATAYIGIHDNFFDLGGHSLLATRIVSRIRTALRVDLPLKMLFEHPTVAEMSAHIDHCAYGSPPIYSEHIGRQTPELLCPLSIAQRRLWFLEQLDPLSGAYHIALSLKLVGELSLSAMEQALAEIVRRHEALRSSVKTDDGSPYQIVESVRPVLHRLDLIGMDDTEHQTLARRLISLLHSRIYDLAEAPLIRTWIVKIADREHVLALTMHHLISDGWSMNIFNDELAALYESFSAGVSSSLSEPPIQYRDFAAWQNDWSKSGRLDAELSYWKRQLGGYLPVVDIPADHPRPAARSFDGATVSYPLDAGSRNSLKRIADAEGATLFMAYLASFLTLLYRYTGQSELILGIPISGRNRPEVELLIGFFVNTLVLRTNASGSLTLRQMIRQTRDVCLEAYAHQDAPFELLVEELQPERNPSRSPLFDIMFDLQPESGRSPRLANLDIAPFTHDNAASKFDITVSIADSAADPAVIVEYATALFEANSIHRLIAHFNLLIESAVREPDLPIAQLTLMTQSEMSEILVGFNDASRAFPDQSCIHDLFDVEAARHRDSVALVLEDDNVTYGLLSRRADALSRMLTRRGVSTESRVGVCLPRSIDMIVGLIAVLKAGGAYVPIDPSYPPARLEFMAGDAEIELLITLSDMLGRVPTPSENILCVDRLSYDDEPAISGPGQAAAFPDSLAYVIYTSGTTGSPKGVAVTHKGVVRLVKAANYADLDDTQVFLQNSTISFDVATFEIWGCLLNGARLILMSDEMQSLEDIERTIIAHGVTTAWMTAGVFHLMAGRRVEALDSLRQLLAGGEALLAEQVNHFIRAAGPGRLINGYGPTEVTTFTCWHRFDRALHPSRAVPIGRPISNTNVYLLDQSLNPVPITVKGQIYASGPGLARCYLNSPDLTAEKFQPNPFSLAEGERMYGTGDIGSYVEGGTIEFHGRVDSQIKLRGFRIELGEIESVLASCPGVSQAVVMIRPDQIGERRLAAYVTARPGAELTPRALLELAKSELPDFMVPSSFVILDTIPLTRIGKVDRSALPAPDMNLPLEEAQFEPPRNSIEEGLARVWVHVLGRERIGIHDDFFTLGGHSLLATQVVSRIREAFQVELPLRSLFENRDISRLGAVVEALLLDRLESLSEEEAADLLG
ncbi:MAG: hypothetical protein DMF61_04355 [Blastocatellia bacterium AA13]|nr:MAG: hypothetical protein DMF61_04355 [Blastocatellia bacterium AA13]